MRNRCTASLLPFLTLLPFLPLWVVPLASWGRRYLDEKGLLPNSILPYPLRSRSCATSLQSVKALHRSQSLPSTREASAKGNPDARLEGNTSPAALYGRLRLRLRPLSDGPAHLCWGCAWVPSAGTTRAASKDLTQVTQAHPSAAQVSHSCYWGRAGENVGTSRFPVPPSVGKISF